MNSPFTPASSILQAFNCPFCGAFAKQTWSFLLKMPDQVHTHQQRIITGALYINELRSAQCDNCNQHSLWLGGKMLSPFTGSAPLPNPDMPEDVKQDYEEARSILSISPRGAAALLRLAIQKLCKHLGGAGENINNDIKQLVKDGLPEKLQRALDSVRVIGNEAVHPGQLDLKDDILTANKLFAFINIICDNRITQPKQINEFYEEKIPENLKDAIEKRDGK